MKTISTPNTKEFIIDVLSLLPVEFCIFESSGGFLIKVILLDDHSEYIENAFDLCKFIINNYKLLFNQV